MKNPSRKRCVPSKLINVSPKDLPAIAKGAKYVGSPEHKDFPSELIYPNSAKPRADATKCPHHIKDLKLVNNWLKEAIMKGAISEYRMGNFPKFVWYKNGSDIFLGRLVNKEKGEYKGFPITIEECPKGFEKIYK